MDFAVGDIVGWRFSLFNDQGEQAEHSGEVVAVYEDWLCIRSHHVKSNLIDPFLGRRRHMCHMIQKKTG